MARFEFEIPSDKEIRKLAKDFFSRQKKIHEIIITESELEKNINRLKKLGMIKAKGSPNFKMNKEALNLANVHIGENFCRYFLGKTEKHVSNLNIRIYELQKNSQSNLILDDLGDRSEIELTHFIGLIKRQSNGEPGPLLTNHNQTVAFIKDKYKNLWILDTYYCSHNYIWLVEAHPINGDLIWKSGIRILSPFFPYY